MNLDRHWLNINCPKCSYIIEIQMISARLEDTIICNNCKINIKLEDSSASVYTSARNVDKAWNDLLNTFKDFK